MSNKEQYQNNEMTIWDYFKLIFKNWIWIVLFTVVAAMVSLVYSFVFEAKDESEHYNFSALVLYDEWDYYPPSIHNYYVRDFHNYFEATTGTSNFAYVELRDINAQDDKYEYRLYVTYLSTIDKDRALELSDMIMNWHNSMITSEFEKTTANQEKFVEDLLAEYTENDLAYKSYINENPSTDSTESVSLAAMRDISFKLLEDAEAELKNINRDALTIDSFYAELYQFYPSSANNTKWKSNLIVGCIMGIFISLVFVLGKKSYMDYKRNK